MIEKKDHLISEIKRLANLLDEHYNLKLDFRNHCYLRIAYDAVVQDKWDFKVRKPFTKYGTNEQLSNAIDLLKVYLVDEKKLLHDNKNSLEFRKKRVVAYFKIDLFD